MSAYSQLMAKTAAATERDVLKALARLDRAYADVERALTAIEPTQAGFEAMTRLADRCRDYVTQAAAMRAVLAARIAAEDALSLSGLAQKIGVSKERAAQFVQTAKKMNQKTETKEQS